MSRSVFGWSYPPGCSGPPDDEGPCAVCGNGVDDCTCPECPICKTIGDPHCYRQHGLNAQNPPHKLEDFVNLIAGVLRRDPSMGDEADIIDIEQHGLYGLRLKMGSGQIFLI